LVAVGVYSLEAVREPLRAGRTEHGADPGAAGGGVSSEYSVRGTILTADTKSGLLEVAHDFIESAMLPGALMMVDRRESPRDLD
jgi:hypothetical protein